MIPQSIRPCLNTHKFRIGSALTLPLVLAALSVASAQNERIGRIEQPLLVKKAALWPGEIPVCWDTWNAGDSQARGWVADAIAGSWERFSAVRFYGWVSCAGFADVGRAIRITVADVNPATQKLGSAVAGVQGGILLNFTYNMWTGDSTGAELCADGGRVPLGFPGSGFTSHREFCTRLTAIHEFGHALGFAHEDWRGDRFGCNEPWAAQGDNGDWAVTAYDLQSVMNYCNPNWIGFGQLSFQDRWGAVALYGGWSPDFAITPNAAAAGMTYLAEAHRHPDELNVFYQGPDRAVATVWSNRAVGGGSWQNPFPLTPPGAAKAETPIAAVARGNQLHVFFIGPDNALASTWTDGGPWANPFPITPPGAARGDSPLAAVVRGDQLHVFYIGPDGALASNWSAPNVDGARWHDPFPITPPGASGARSRLDVVLRGSMLNVFYQGADGAFGTAWSMPEVDGGRWQLPFPITPPGAGIAGSAIDGVLRGEELHVFYQGPDGALATNWSAPNADAGRWHDPFPITPPGAGRRGAPLAALLRGSDFDVHFIGPDGAVATVWARPSVANGRWQTPYPVTPPGFARANSMLAATTRAPQTMDVFFLGQLGELKSLWAGEPRRR